MKTDMRMCKFVIIIGFLINISSKVAQGSPTASNGVQMELLDLERKLQINLRDYLDELQQKLLKIRLGFKEMRRFSVQVNDEEHFSNLLCVFALMRHMHADWRKWLALMRARVGDKQIRFLRNKRLQITSNEELQGSDSSVGDKQIRFPRNKRRKITSYEELQRAAAALLRIQQMYILSEADVASGLLDGKQYDTALNAMDCLHLAFMQHDGQRYVSSAAWLELALGKLTAADIEIMRLPLAKLFQLQMKNFRRQNKRFEALRFLYAAMQKLPQSVELRLLRFEFMAELRATKTPALLDPAKYFDIELCSTKIPSYSTLLHCRYEAEKDPFLKLAPFKLEELSLDPYIMLYHSVLHDNEIEHIKTIAMPNLVPSETYNMTTGDTQIDESRTAKVFWLADDVSPTITRVNRRIEHMTGFTIEDAEALQAMQYGPGGHYLTHTDFFHTTDSDKGPHFERIATVLFYLNDVPHGGVTFFPFLDLIVEPRKNSALIWHNLNNRGFGHMDTQHTACPVIVGTKWVLTKWIDRDAQTFIKPCLAIESIFDEEFINDEINFD